MAPIGNRPDLIICDVNMPVMDGISFLKTIKQDDDYALCRFIPVLMLTTESEKSMMEEGKKAGVRAWMHKPFEPGQTSHIGENDYRINRYGRVL